MYQNPILYADYSDPDVIRVGEDYYMVCLLYTSSEDGIEKPEKITIMVDGTVTTKANDRDAFEARWEELTGIDLEIIQPDHDAYMDVCLLYTSRCV